MGGMSTQFYSYHLLGMEIYEGLIYPENQDLLNDAEVSILYTHINLNDFANGLSSSLHGPL
jgi:hypothetical protein